MVPSNFDVVSDLLIARARRSRPAVALAGRLNWDEFGRPRLIAGLVALPLGMAVTFGGIAVVWVPLFAYHQWDTGTWQAVGELTLGAIGVLTFTFGAIAAAPFLPAAREERRLAEELRHAEELRRAEELRLEEALKRVVERQAEENAQGTTPQVRGRSQDVVPDEEVTRRWEGLVRRLEADSEHHEQLVTRYERASSSNRVSRRELGLVVASVLGTCTVLGAVLALMAFFAH